MSRKVEALKKVAVALGYGSAVTDYTGNTISYVLREIAVKMECASSVDNILVKDTADVLEYIAANYGSEAHEPFDLTITKTHATVTIKRNGKNIAAGADVLYNGDKIKVTAAAAEGYELTTLTLNGETIDSGDEFVVDGEGVTIVATGTLKTFDLERTAENCTVAVTKGGQAVSDGEDVLTYGDEITITATATDGYEMTELKVNGETFTSGETLTISDDVTITATAESQ